MRFADLQIATESGATSNTVAFDFFGKHWSVKVRRYGKLTSEQNKALSAFLKQSAILSKKYEAAICSTINKYNEDPSYSGIPANIIKHYSDIPNMRITQITVDDLHGSDKDVIIILQGEYPIDGEHGWAIGLKNGTVLAKKYPVAQYSDMYLAEYF